MKLVVKINKKKYQIVHSRNFSFLGSGASSVRGAHVAKGSTGPTRASFLLIKSWPPLPNDVFRNMFFTDLQHMVQKNVFETIFEEKNKFPF